MDNNTVLFDRFYVRIGLTNDMLGTNPISMHVMDEHILDRQRKLIAENSQINKAVNKYLDAKQISDEQGRIELDALRARTEEILGRDLQSPEFEALKEGNFKDFKELLETMSELKDKGITCFFRNPNGEVNTESGRRDVVIGTHMILGFLKAAGETICRQSAAKKGEFLKSGAYTTSCINQMVSITSMNTQGDNTLIPSSKDIKRNEDGTPNYLQRSLRAMTAQGPRISLAKSEVLPKGSVFEFCVSVLRGEDKQIIKEDHLKKMLSYGQIKGLGQWRNASYGTFEVVEFSKMPDTTM